MLMMKKINNKKETKTKSFRADAKLIEKLEFISKKEFRDFTGQINYALNKFVDEYEKEHNLKDDEEYKKID
jgi:hypothetical protein